MRPRNLLCLLILSLVIQHAGRSQPPRQPEPLDPANGVRVMLGVEIEGRAAAPETVRLRSPGVGKYTAKFVADTEGARAEATLALTVP